MKESKKEVQLYSVVTYKNIKPKWKIFSLKWLQEYCGSV